MTLVSDKLKAIEIEDRIKVEAYFKSKNLILKRIQETTEQTPDYSVHFDDQLIAYCELKSIMQDDWMDGDRSDPVYNRIQKKIHDDERQLLFPTPLPH